MNATDDYIQKLANLIKYGSDGVNPYTCSPGQSRLSRTEPEPASLHRMVQRDLELGVHAEPLKEFSLPGARSSRTRPTARSSTSTASAPNGNYQRWTALRTVETSNIFRSVWGDAAMGSTIRVLLEYQYDNGQGTAQGELSFIDRYFNNGDGTAARGPASPGVLLHLGRGWGRLLQRDATRRASRRRSSLSIPVSRAPALPRVPSRWPRSARAWTFTGNSGIVSDTAKSLLQFEPRCRAHS